MPKLHELSGPAILQLNVEGLTRPKCDVIQKIAINNSIAVILLQETHATNDDKITIYGYSLIGSINHPKHGIATLVRNDLPATEIGRSRVDSAIQWLTISIDGEITITNFYKPPNSPFDPPPHYEHLAKYSGDFSCHHTTCGYSRNNHDGEAPHDWPNAIDLKLLYDHNHSKTFYFAAWDTYTYPDLTFFTHDTNSSLLHPVHSVLGNFPKSQHRPTIYQHRPIIYHPTLIEYTPTSPLSGRNFNKADWERFHAVTRNMCNDLPSPESNINLCYAAFQKKLLKIAQDTIPRGFRKNYIPKWDTRCNELAFQHEKTQSVEEKLLSANRLTDHLNAKQKEQWISTVECINMKRSSRRAWSTINKLNGRKNVSPNLNSISPNAVASCLLNNGKFKNPNRQFTR